MEFVGSFELCVSFTESVFADYNTTFDPYAACNCRFLWKELWGGNSWLYRPKWSHTSWLDSCRSVCWVTVFSLSLNMWSRVALEFRITNCSVSVHTVRYRPVNPLDVVTIASTYRLTAGSRANEEVQCSVMQYINTSAQYTQHLQCYYCERDKVSGSFQKSYFIMVLIPINKSFANFLHKPIHSVIP